MKANRLNHFLKEIGWLNTGKHEDTYKIANMTTVWVYSILEPSDMVAHANKVV